MLELAVLDSSPVALPPPTRPLKRSASLASLPTPPRTRHRTGKKRGQSLGSDSECDSADGVSTDSCREDARENGSERVDDCKRRRTSDVLDDEDAFWLGEERLERRGGALGKYGSLKAAASEPEPETSRDQPLVYQRLQQHQDRAGAVNREKVKVASESATSIAPVSPPPSNRKATRVGRTLELDAAASSRTAPTAPVHSPPVTPRPKNKGKKRLQRVFELPERDSPHNPFLDSPSDDRKATPPQPPTSLEEKPTITYVFRGVRGVYPNPFFNHAKKRALSPPPESFLPPEHPDYSPDMRCPPKLLFPTRPAKNRGKREERQEAPPPPSTPTRNRNRSPPKSGRESFLLRLPKVTDAVLGSGPKGRRSLSPYETLGESDEDDDEEGDSGGDGDDEGDGFSCAIKPIKLDFGLGGDGEKRTERRGRESLAREWSRPNLGPQARIKH